jgi:subtilase family protein
MNLPDSTEFDPSDVDPIEVDPVEVVYPRRLIIKFKNDIGMRYEDGAEKNLPDGWPEKWLEITNIFHAATLTRLYVDTSSDRLQQLDKQAQAADKTYEHVDFLAFFTLNLASIDVADEILKLLYLWDIIEYVYLEALPGPNPTVPQALPANPDYQNGSQGYLKSSNYTVTSATSIGGIDAEAAWPLSGAVGSGSGISFIDIEKQWDLNDHEWTDASNTAHFGSTSLIYGHNYSDPAEIDPQHGSKVLGIIAMQDNAFGGVGIARDASGKLVSVWRDPRSGETPSIPYVHDLPEALMKAIDNLGLGDVLLIERQLIPSGSNVLHPVEMDPAVFAEIRLATALGIAVIEPAGNIAQGAPNSVDLDNATNSLGVRILDRADTSVTSPFKDSGAIMVAGAYASPVSTPTSTPPYPKLHTNQGYWHTNSNYGSRVDCFAWGELVYTTAGNNSTTGSFKGTSAASAIVAGAVILLQALAKATRQIAFHPSQLRQILKSTGTPAAADNPNPIGVMPNLSAFMTNALNLTPDVVIRDNLNDTGLIHTGTISISPDVIVRPANGMDSVPIVNQNDPQPQIAFGGSATMGNAALSRDFITGSAQDIFVRVFNRGGATANDVQTTVYWSPPGTHLLRPDQWTKIVPGGIPVLPNPINAPVSTTSMTVLRRIRWASGLPSPGHYCFIATVGCATDPDPLPNPAALINPANPNALTFDEFYALIRNNNNITWKNFNVLPLPPPGAHAIMSFHAPGAFDQDRPMELEIAADFPPGAELVLAGETGFINALLKGRFETASDEKMQLPLNPSGVNQFEKIPFRVNSLNPLQLTVRFPDQEDNRTYELFARQLYEGEEIGRITWRFVPPAKKGWMYWLDSLRKLFASLSPLNCLLLLLLALALLIILVLVLSRS